MWSQSVAGPGGGTRAEPFCAARRLPALQPSPDTNGVLYAPWLTPECQRE